MTDWLFFNSTEFIFKILNAHWLVLGFLWGLFKIYARRSKKTWDDELVQMINDLKDQKQTINERNEP